MSHSEPLQLPVDYRDRVYAGWLGKCIGVRLGAPIENWTHDAIRDNLGEIDGFFPLPPGSIFKPDDDTAFPMILIRALEDYGTSPDITAQQISDTRHNYVGDQHGTSQELLELPHVSRPAVRLQPGERFRCDGLRGLGIVERRGGACQEMARQEPDVLPSLRQRR